MKAKITVLAGICALMVSGIAGAQTFGARLCANDSRYTCYTVKRGDTWQKVFPHSTKRDLVMRINRMNTHLYPGMRIAVPKDSSNTNMLSYAPVSRHIAPPNEKVIIISVNSNQLAFGAYNADGSLQYWGPVSGGKSYCSDTGRGCRTATGEFRIYNRGGAGCRSTKYPIGRGGAPMPYCMYFHGGYALHGSYDVPGYNASHGCVRMFVKDAEWLYNDFTEGDNVKVVVKSSQI